MKHPTSPTGSISTGPTSSDMEASSNSFTQADEEAFANLTFSATRFITQRDRDCVFKSEYAVGTLIGTGGFGNVYNCVHLATNQERAVKMVAKSEHKKDRKAIMREFEMLTKLDHPNLIKAYEMFEDEENYYIITDLYKGGDLFDRVQVEGPLSEADVAIVVHRLLCGIHYCHQKNIVHRDLKLENVLIHDGNLSNVKIIDFGLAKQWKNNSKPLDEIIGSPSYISPQIIDGEYTHKCDLWALGVIAYVLLCGQLPFGIATEPQTIHNIQSGHVPFDHPEFEDVTPACIAFVHHLLEPEEDKRPSAKQALQHDWLQSILERQARRSLRKSILNSTLDNDIKKTLRALRQFRSENCKLKQAVTAFVAYQLLRQEDRTDAVFRALDQGNNGCIHLEDLHDAFSKHMGVNGTMQDLACLMPHINYSGSGMLQYSELSAILALEGSQRNQAQMLAQSVYQYLDKENNGYIMSLDLQMGLRMDPATWAAESGSRMMIAQVSSYQVIHKEEFEEALLGKRASVRISNNGNAFARRVDYLQAETEKWSRNVGKFFEDLIAK